MKTNHARQERDQVIHMLRKTSTLAGDIVCGKTAQNDSAFRSWKETFGGTSANPATQVRQLQRENAKLKRLIADLTLDNALLKELLSKDWAR